MHCWINMSSDVFVNRFDHGVQNHNYGFFGLQLVTPLIMQSTFSLPLVHH